MVKVVAFFLGMINLSHLNNDRNPLFHGALYTPIRTWVDEFIPYMEIMGVDRPNGTPDDTHRQCLILHSHPGVLHPSAGQRQRPKRGHPGWIDGKATMNFKDPQQKYATKINQKMCWKEISQQIWHNLDIQVI